MPAVTVIVPTYQSSRTLACALRTVCDQTFTDFEVWVIGDACTDDSEQVVAGLADARLHWFNLAQHVGSQHGPNNEGLRRARGRYVAYLGHDDLWFPWHLASLVTALEDAQADFAQAMLVRIGPDGPAALDGAPGITRVAHRSAAPPTSWLHRRDLIESCGMWPEPRGRTLYTDVAFQGRAVLAGKRFVSSGELSAVKFPSHWWKTYARRDGQPQEGYLARMIEDPQRLRSDLLMQLVRTYALRDAQPSARDSLAAAWQSIGRRFGDWYGYDRWPLSSYIFWRRSRWRRRSRALRGLPIE